MKEDENEFLEKVNLFTSHLNLFTLVGLFSFCSHNMSICFYHTYTHTRTHFFNKLGFLPLFLKAGTISCTYVICMEHTQQSLFHLEESMFQQALAPVSTQSSNGTMGHRPKIKGLVHDIKIFLKFSVSDALYYFRI